MTRDEAGQLLTLLGVRYPQSPYARMDAGTAAMTIQTWEGDFGSSSLEEVLAGLRAAEAGRDVQANAFPPTIPQIKAALAQRQAPPRPSLDEALHLCLRASHGPGEAWLAQEHPAVALWARRNGGVWAVTHENVEDSYRRGALERSLREAYDELVADPQAAARQLRSSEERRLGGELRRLPPVAGEGA